MRRHKQGVFRLEQPFQLGVERLFAEPQQQADPTGYLDWQELTQTPFAVFTNFTGMDRQFRRTIDLLHDAVRHSADGARAKNFRKILSAEHGLYGIAQAGVTVQDGVDQQTGLPIFSLYGPQKKPTPELLADVETIFFEFQDIGMRCYTFLSSLYYLLEAAHEQQKRVVLLDRPNPLGGLVVEGGLVAEEQRSFVSIAPIPLRHGMSFGELARLFCAMNGWDRLELVILPLAGWRREMWFDQTGLPFVPPSPNLPTLESIVAYSASVFVEGTELSEGRGTTKPFEWVGAPWLNGQRLADSLNALELPGVLFRPTFFEPKHSKHTGAVCEGVQLHITDRDHFRGAAVGLHLLEQLRDQAPEQFRWWVYGENRHFIDLLFGRQSIRRDFERGRPVPDILQEWTSECETFQKLRAQHLLYGSPIT